jgi:Fe-S cluster assembly iron-binding protein IscA
MKIYITEAAQNEIKKLFLESKHEKPAIRIMYAGRG